MADYESDTQHLSLMEHGAYRLLLDYYYKHKKPLPANASVLHRVCRAFADEERTSIQSVLDQFFTLKADGWHQKRADEELKKAAEISKKRAAAARVKHSGKRTSQKPKKIANSQEKSDSANAEHVQSKCTANAPTTHNIKEIHTSATAEAQTKSRDLLFDSVVSLCRINPKLCTAEQRGALNQTCGILRKAGRTADQVEAVGDWWWKFDWRGKQGQAPTPAQIREVWDQAFVPAKAADEHPNAYRPGKMVY